MVQRLLYFSPTLSVVILTEKMQYTEVGLAELLLKQKTAYYISKWKT